MDAHDEEFLFDDTRAREREKKSLLYLRLSYAVLGLLALVALAMGVLYGVPLLLEKVKQRQKCAFFPLY